MLCISTYFITASAHKSQENCHHIRYFSHINLYAIASMGSKHNKNAHAHLIAAVAAGELTPQEAKACADLLEGYRKHYETLDLEQRITALEERK